MKELTILIPCLNEEETIAQVIRDAMRGLRKASCEGEVLVSDNGSTDASVQIALSQGARVVHCPRRGYGSALRYGIESSQSQYVLFGDADGSYDLSNIGGFVEGLRDGYDLVIGTRLKGCIEPGAMPFLHRYLGTPILTWLLNFLFRMRITDCNSGMRGLRKDVFEKMQLMSGGMEFASEMLIKTGILALKVKEIPITLYQDKRSREPHLHTWSDGWRHLRLLLIYAPNHLFIYPGFFLFLVGTLLLFLQLGGPVALGYLHMDLHFMILGISMSVLGISILQMGMIIKLFSHQNHYYENDWMVRKLNGFSFNKKVFSGLGVALIGGVIFSKIFLDWIHLSLANPQMIRLALFGLYFIFMGISLILFFFVESVMSENQE
jgi:glycosyltransferase involved in cell wall biosynthesis